MAFCIHVVCVGNGVIQLKLLCYMAVCAFEIYVLKYMVCDYDTFRRLDEFANQQLGSFLRVFIPASPEESQDRLNLWGRPIDMDTKENKLTYQKTRLGIIIFFTVLSNIFDSLLGLFVGTSSLEFLQKRDRSVFYFIILVALIVFRQKYEHQIYKKYDLETLNFGKVFYLPTFFLTFSLTMTVFSKDQRHTGGLLFCHFIFLIAYFNCFWEKGCRTLGIN